MSRFFDFAPLFTLTLFILPTIQRKVSRILLWTAPCVLLSIAAGIHVKHPAEGILLGSLYLCFGAFSFLLRSEVEKTNKKNIQRKDVLKEKAEKMRSGFEQWSRVSERTNEEIRRIAKRYDFARGIVSYTEEKEIFQDLTLAFASTKEILGISYSASGGAHPVFTSGPSLLAESPHSYFMPLNIPVRWGASLQGFLTLLLSGPLSKELSGELNAYAQLLGLGLHKISLYKTMVERSRRDGLTNLYLRRVFMERLTEEINFSKRYGKSFSLLMLDLDDFKKVNDTYGHPAGDRVLKGVAECLNSQLHPGVTICRYGGEEFSILIGLATWEEVVQSAEGIRKAVENLSFPLDEGKAIGITVSIGIAHFPTDGPPPTPSPEEMIRRADSALYKAKQSGRNRVKEWNG